ncbi:MAG TPA: adenosylcobinamide-GDP ribazoletransferase [Candidatus Bathyarchaeia archaeon]|nr:adenosylcobinamide-GDP ribazoletransferase [Candidatus Bathyarchaeia archaeon]
MSKSNAIKTFRDLLAFLTIIPIGSGEDFVAISAEYMFLFPLMGGLIGLFAAGYFLLSGFIVSGLLGFVNSLIQVPADFLLRLALAIMTLAFVLVLTGLQHFDGLVDLGNAIGLRRLEERREAAHAWIVTYKGAFLAIFVEFLAFLGLFFINAGMAVRVIIVAEVAAKLGMVTIMAVGQPTSKGLGARFMVKAKRKRNVIAYVIAFVVAVPLLGWAGLLVVAVSVLSGVLMEQVGRSVFGGVSGDMIGATNESARAVTLVLLAGVLAL